MHESVPTLDVSIKGFWGAEDSGKVSLTQFLPYGNDPFPIPILNHGRRTQPSFRFTRQVKF
ncbi:hypothetical protein J2793_006994 [Paraburkholderia caledonica]|uniref:Uncharacterized protein n=1 Tax=Paraburkholderia caledonica TaxID=134536 RepID=A0AB73INE4_9BURK|nr:hypothetical protein [Paraburkholderia caledonica]